MLRLNRGLVPMDLENQARIKKFAEELGAEI
jgi:hypothetical protein